MARASLLAQSLARLLEAEGTSKERFIDLCISLRVHETGEELVRVGGKWDRRLKRYTADADEIRVISVHKGQLPAAKWFSEWLRRKCSEHTAMSACSTDEEIEEAREEVWKDFRRVWSAIFVGGRRGGKSRLAVWSLCLFAICFGGTQSWCVSPTQEETEELERAIRETLPRLWYRYRGDPKFEFRLSNGSVIRLLSGHKPRTLKRGSVDFALYNEGQNMSKKGFVQLRGATADTGGLTIIAANPPDEPIGFWIEEFHEKAEARKIDSEAFQFDPRENPFINYSSLTSLEHEVDDETYRREVLGEFVPIGDKVFHAWNDMMSFADVPAEYVDITAEFTKQHLGRAFGHIVGSDFQRNPMAAIVMKVYRSPLDKSKTPLLWVVDEFAVTDADEDELIDALESPPEGPMCPCCVAAGRQGYRGWIEDSDSDASPVVAAMIGDASGEWQDADRTKGKGSFDWFRARGWKFLYQPDPKMKKNPEISERCKASNALLKSRSGIRRLYISKHCTKTRRAMKHWPNKNGVADRRSEHAHLCDAVTYPCWRFFPRRKVPKLDRNPPKVDKRFRRARDMKGW